MSFDPKRPVDREEDIAVVGMACLYPGAPDVQTFWRNILSKVDAITDPPQEAWDSSLYYEAGTEENDRVYCRKGGYLGPIAHFDPLEHGIMPRAVEGGEPDQWLALHVAREALRDAGYTDASKYRERAALILGKGTYANRGTLSVVQHALIVDYTLGLLRSLQPNLTQEELRHIRADLKRHLPRFDAETAPALIPNVTAGRIANRLDIMGPSYTVDAACASSLLAIDIAVKGLRHGEYDLALVGGMQVATPLPVLSLFCQLKALSPSERIRPFDKDADGTLLSEGVGMAVLKRRSQAEADGDRIYAVVKGTGVASDGRAVGILAPRVEGEELALRRAYDSAGIAPSSIGLLEAHGTGTLVGDAVEVEALTRVFGERKQAPRCALGSVKSMIGHTMPAAGMAGFIKAVLALHYKVLPPTLNVSSPSPRLRIERSPFYLNTETRPWIHGDSSQPRRAGINSFGFGGINAHVVVEETSDGPAAATHDTEWETEVFLFSGTDRDDLLAQCRRVTPALLRNPVPRLADVAFSLNAHRGAQGSSMTLAIVARSVDELARKIDRAVTRLHDPACSQIKDAGGIYFFESPLGRQGKIAFVFPGEGAPYVNMLGDLCRHFPEVRSCFDAMDRALFNHPRGYRLSDVVFPPPSFSESERQAAERRLLGMDVAVESVVTANHAIFTLLGRLGIVPDALVGHSSGEYSAMRAARMFDDAQYDESVVELNDRQYRRNADTDEIPAAASLFAIGASRERVEAVCAASGVRSWIAMDNCRHQVVVITDRTAAAGLEVRLRTEGLLYERLGFDRPYHTPDFMQYAETLRGTLEKWIVRPAAIPLYSCTSIGVYPADLPQARQLALDHWMKPVEFRRTMERMWDDGFRIFVESGPRGNLTAFIEDILTDRPFAAVAANVSRRTGITQLHHLVAQLAAQGVSLTLDPLYERRNLTRMDWSADAARPPRRSLGKVKLPTGAPEMGLSPEVIEMLRGRAAGDRTLVPVSAAPEARPAAPAVAFAPPLGVAAVVEGPIAPVEVRTALAPTARPGTSHVLSAFLGTMDRFLNIEQSLMQAAFTPNPHPVASAAAREKMPLIEPVGGEPGRQLTARCILDFDSCPFLRDHTLGRNVSAVDHELTGFPIVPFTGLMEIMAEAAAALAPGEVVIGMREVRVHRWLAVDRGPLELTVSAERIREGGVTVRIEDASAIAGTGPVAEGLMVLGTSYPPAPTAQPLELADAQAYRFAPGELYARAMFHGPLFQGVRSIDRVGTNGAEATIVVGPRKGLLGAGLTGTPVTDFVLLDQPGQVVGFWTSQYLERGFVVLPFRMGALHLYGPPAEEGQQFICRARIALVGDQQVRSDLEVVDAHSRVVMRFEDWEDRRFDLPGTAFDALLRPASARLSRSWPVANASTATSHAIAFRIGLDDFPPGWLLAHGGMWARVLAALTLGRRERALWNALNVPERRRLEWLFGRVAAKDAVREYAQRMFNIALHPADVEILPDAAGRPTVTGGWTAQVPRVPLISISHVDGAAVALLADGEGLVGVGIDLERYGRMKPGMEQVAFNAREREMLDSVDGEERQSWALRLWCAKEALAKATGCDTGPVSSALAVERIYREQGTVVLKYQPPNAGVMTLSASTAREGDWIVATCVR